MAYVSALDPGNHCPLHIDYRPRTVGGMLVLDDHPA
jgi:hypothetical protein